MMLLFSHDSAIGWRSFRSYFQEDPVLDDLHALVEFARSGSIAGAASSAASIRERPTVASAINRMVTLEMLNMADHT
jgi:hypothetical protein